MRPGGAAHQPDRHRHLDGADQRAALVLFPARERRVAAAAASVGMGARLHRTPVIARRDDDRIDPVHDPLVVRGGPVRVHHGEGAGIEDALDDLVAAALLGRQHLRCDAHPCLRQAQIGQVRQDAQPHHAARDFLDQWRDRLGHRVHRVGAHRIAHVDDQVHHHHRAARRVGEHMHLDVAAAAAQTDQHLVAAVGHLQNLSAMAQQGLTGAVGIGHAKQLDLTPHQRLGTRRLEAAALAHQLGHERCGRDHRGLFHHHRHQHVAPVDDEIGGHAHRQLEGADHVLDHAVGQCQRERAGRGEQGQVFGCQASGAPYFLQALRRGQSTKIRQS